MAMPKYFWAQFGHSSYLGCREDRLGNGLRALFSLERTQEIDDFLLLLSSQPIEMFKETVSTQPGAHFCADSMINCMGITQRIPKAPPFSGVPLLALQVFE